MYTGAVTVRRALSGYHSLESGDLLLVNANTDLRWPFAVRPLTPNLGAEVAGVNLAEDLSAELFGAIYRAWLRYQVLLFPPLDLPPHRQVEFAQIGRAHV